MKHLRAAFCAALFLFGAGLAVAQDITLLSPDGGVEIDGTLLGFDGEFYRVDTVYGELTVDGSGVRCEGPGCPSLTGFVPRIRLSGSSTMADVLLPGLIRAFATREGWRVAREPVDDTHFDLILTRADQTEVARFALRRTNADEGFADLLADEADITLTRREIRPDEATRALEIGLGDLTEVNRSRVLALDALIAIVAPSNPVREISVAELAQVLSGRIDNWQSLGGPDAPIALHLREPGSGVMQNLQDRLLAASGWRVSPAGRRHFDAETLADAVARDPLGLGMTGFSEAGPARPLALAGPCGLRLEASRLTVKTEDYPLSAPMFLYLPARRLPKVARDFLRFTTSPAAQVMIRRAGLVDQAAEEIAVDDQGNRLANAIQSAGEEVALTDIQQMIGRLRPMSRLSLTFRFDSGSARLDAPSRSNVLRLAQSLQLGRYDNRTLLFAGFSDGQGPAVRNRSIAASRAIAVREAVTAAAEGSDLSRVTLQAEAYGEAMPMACDDTAWGRDTNRRVEVWVR